MFLLLGQLRLVRCAAYLRAYATTLPSNHNQHGSVLYTSMAADSNLTVFQISIRRRISRAHMINVLTDLNSARISKPLMIAEKCQRVQTAMRRWREMARTIEDARARLWVEKHVRLGTPTDLLQLRKSINKTNTILQEAITIVEIHHQMLKVRFGAIPRMAWIMIGTNACPSYLLIPNKLVKPKEVLANGLIPRLLSPAKRQVHVRIRQSTTTKWRSEKSAQAERPRQIA